MTEPTKADQHVRLTGDAGDWFSDLAGKTGVIVAMDGWPVTEWVGLTGRMRINPKFLEVVE
jgi:hypothetical protein